MSEHLSSIICALSHIITCSSANLTSNSHYLLHISPGTLCHWLLFLDNEDIGSFQHLTSDDSRLHLSARFLVQPGSRGASK